MNKEVVDNFKEQMDNLDIRLLSLARDARITNSNMGQHIQYVTDQWQVVMEAFKDIQWPVSFVESHAVIEDGEGDMSVESFKLVSEAALDNGSLTTIGVTKQSFEDDIKDAKKKLDSCLRFAIVYELKPGFDGRRSHGVIAADMNVPEPTADLPASLLAAGLAFVSKLI